MSETSELRHRGEKRGAKDMPDKDDDKGKEPVAQPGPTLGQWLIFAGASVLLGAILMFSILWYLGDVNPEMLWAELRNLVSPQDEPHPVHKIGPNKWLEEQRATGEILFTRETLAPFNASKAHPKRSIVLCVLGSCFDVTTGREFYEEGNDYNCFAGHDGSRAYVTGIFKKEGCTDEVLDLSAEQLVGVEHWRKFYHDHKVYEYIGKLVGRFYDARGNPTAELLEVEKRVHDEKEAEKARKRLPDCNVRFRPTAGAEVWCSKNSGGVQRDWVGVPRMVYESSGRRKCICVTEEEVAASSASAFQAYKNCTLDEERGTLCFQKKAKISAQD